MTSKSGKINLATLILYSFGFLLLWEWLRPLQQLTDTANTFIFLGFVAISLLLPLMNIRQRVRMVIKTGYILVASHYLYFDQPFFSFTWLLAFFADFFENIMIMLKSDWPNLSNVFRSVLFFILLAIMSYLMRYWLSTKRNIFTFFLMTMVYITVLDTFTPYQADWAIVRTVIIGFGMMGILTYFRLMEKENMNSDGVYFCNWFVPILALIVFSVTVGFVVPKPKPVWSDPVPFFKAYMEKSGAAKEVGYGMDDSKLGGPFRGDDTVVFQAVVESQHYWKVESKDVYTGKGWVVTENDLELLPFTQQDVVPLPSFTSVVETSKELASINYEERYNHIVYPQGLERIAAEPSFTFGMDPVTEKIYSVKGAKKVVIGQFWLTYEIPEFSVTALMGESEKDLNLENNHFVERYTQLPESIPVRVNELAKEITAGKETWFEKAEAIESYFNESEYVYDTVNVLVPDGNEDYVDQFLFDSKRGYCDNFSTSMVVMLRTLGIPARWTKGYTEGEFKRLEENNKRLVEITNNHAHSWVEVYFPNIGWVPFEPTKGYSNPARFNYDTYKEEPIQNKNEPVEEALIEKNPEMKDENDTGKNSFFWLNNLGNDISDFFIKQVEWIVLVSAIVFGMSVTIYRTRVKWLPSFYIWKFSRSDDDGHFPKAYLVLLMQLERQGIMRKEHQTLRAYAQSVDRTLGENKMEKLTASYEEYLYRGLLKKGSWSELKEIWKKLIKMTIA